MHGPGNLSATDRCTNVARTYANATHPAHRTRSADATCAALCTDGIDGADRADWRSAEPNALR
ncbi:MAG: hypothetical protein ACKOE2_07370 [Actinomycetales bacterium]